MAKLSKELTSGTLHPREALFISGILGALDAEIVLDADGCSTVSLDLRGTFSHTVQLSGTVDGTNWVPIPVRAMNVAAISYVSLIVGTVSGVWAGKCAQYKKVRARVTAYTSVGSTATLMADTAVLDDSLQGMVTTSAVTATGASGAAVTLTLPSPGAGLRQYITYIGIIRSATALLTAGAAPTVVTTTNLPGSLAFTFGADAAPQGTDKVIREDFAYPLAASAQSTTVTIVCPLTTGVIWRVTAGYYVAP